jgi:hypothetical protein
VDVLLEALGGNTYCVVDVGFVLRWGHVRVVCEEVGAGGGEHGGYGGCVPWEAS